MRDAVEWTPPEFVMSDDPGPIRVMNRCFRNDDHVICPVARGLIPGNPHEAVRRLIDPTDPELIPFLVRAAASIPHRVLMTTKSLKVIQEIASQFKNSEYIRHLARERGRILIEGQKKAPGNGKPERIPQEAAA